MKIDFANLPIDVDERVKTCFSDAFTDGIKVGQTCVAAMYPESDCFGSNIGYIAKLEWIKPDTLMMTAMLRFVHDTVFAKVQAICHCTDSPNFDAFFHHDNMPITDFFKEWHDTALHDVINNGVLCNGTSKQLQIERVLNNAQNMGMHRAVKHDYPML